MVTDTAHLVCDLPDQRLDTYIAGRWQGFSRSQVQKMIQEGRVQVNNQVARPSTRLRIRDLISIQLPDATPAGLIPQELPLTIVYQDDQVLVVDKLSGQTVHPTPGHPTGTLVNVLISRYPELKEVGNRLRPGIVHRLDAYTSGLMVIARTPLAYESLSRQFKERAITKVYLALVKGHPEPREGTIEAPIARHLRDRQRMSVVAGGRDATTSYSTLRLFKGFTLLEVRPRTGRTHQIRVHMSALGHPIAGDAKYGGRVPFLPRQFLHAHHLGFHLPNSSEYAEFTSPLPSDLDEALSALEPIS